MRYTEKGLDILARRNSEGDLGGGVGDGSSSSSGVASSSAATDHLRCTLRDEAETLSRALHIMTIVPKMANDMMMVGRLQGFDVRKTNIRSARCPSPSSFIIRVYACAFF